MRFARSDPLTLDIGYSSSLGPSVVIEIQTLARRMGWNEFAKRRLKVRQIC